MRKFINRIVALFLSLCMAMQLGAGDVFFVFAQSLDDPVIESGTQPVSEEPTVPEESTDQVETEPPKEDAVLTVEYLDEAGNKLIEDKVFSGIYVDDTVKAIDIELPIGGYTLDHVIDPDNEYVLGQDLILSKSEKAIKLIYKEEISEEATDKDEPTEDNNIVSDNSDNTSANSVVDEGDDEKPIYYEVRYYDENGNPIGVTTSGSNIQYVKAGESTTPPSRPVLNNEGEKFVGWFTEPNGQGNQIAEFGPINADMNCYAYYEAQTTHTIKIDYVFADTENQAFDSYIATVANGDAFKAEVTSPILEGYTIDQPTVSIDIPSVTEDVTYTVKYSGEKQTYTVRHMLQTPDGSDYVKTDEETKEGYIGNYTAAEAKTYEGFHSLSFQNILITPTTTESNTVIEIKYDRNFYNLSFITGDKGSYVPSVSVRYGQNLGTIVNDIDEPTRLGYQFIGWSLTNNGEVIDGNVTMPANQTSLYAVWRENTNASYTVVYMLESLTGGYDYITSKTGRGQVGDIIPTTGSLSITNTDWNNANIDPNGVERDTTKDEDVTITSDGQAVKTVYFNRKTFHVNFYLYVKNGFLDWEWQKQDNLTISAKYGEDVSSIWTDDAHSEYMWYTGRDQQTSVGAMSAMPAYDINRYGEESNTVPIYYMVEKVNSDRQYEKYTTGVLPRGWTINEGDIIEIPGFTYERMNTRNSTLYYTRNSYTITFENCVGIRNENLEYEEALANAKPNDDDIQPPATVDDDAVFAGWYTSPNFEEKVDWNSVMPSHNIQLYAKQENPEYTVKFETNGAGPIDPITVKKYESIEGQLPTPTKEGDEFLGWYTDENFNYPFIEETNIVENLTLYAKWKNASIVPYTIRYIDAETKESIAEDTNGNAELNSYVLVEPKPVEGYTANSGSSQKILTHSGQIFEVEYTKKPTWSFTIRYIDIETQQPIIKDSVQSVPDTTSQVVVQSPSVKEQSGLADYMIVSDPQMTVTKDQDGETVVFYYTKQTQSYLVNHQLQMPDGTYQTIETENQSANVGDYVTANPKTYEGYNCISTQYQRSGVVTSHGENEQGLVINVKYNRENELSVTDYFGYYDGVEHGLTVNGSLIDNNLVTEKIEYSTDGQSWSDEPITRKDVNTGASLDYVVYVRFVTVINGETYTSQSEQHKITINPRPVTIKAPNATKIYDGTPLNTWATTTNYIPAVVLENETSLGFVENEGFTTYYYTGESTITTPGTVDNVIDQALTLEQIKTNTKASNYSFDWQSGTLSVTDRPEGQKFNVTITPNSAEYTYDGTQKIVSGIKEEVFTDDTGKALEGYSVEAKFSASGTDAGTYGVELTGDIVIRNAGGVDVTSQFETPVINEAHLLIKKRSVTIQADSGEFDYDGNPHSIASGKVVDDTSLALDHKFTATYTGSAQEQGERVDNVISDIQILDKDGNEVTNNYNITPKNGYIYIKPIDASVVVNITINDAETDYNGQIQNYKDVVDGASYTVTFETDDPNLDTKKWTLSNDEISTSGRYASEYEVTFDHEPTVLDADGNPINSENVRFNVTPGTFTINKIDLVVKANNKSKEYDGTPLVATNSDYTVVNGLADTDSITSISLTGYQLEPGISESIITKNSIQIRNSETDNTAATNSYDITLQPGTLEITNDQKVDRVITITATTDDKIYNGTPLTNGTFIVSGETLQTDILNRSSIKVNGSITTVGNTKNIVDPSSVKIMNGNVDVTEAYTINFVDGTLTVNQRPITLTGATASHVYDGNLFADSSVTQTGTLATGDTFSGAVVAIGTIKDVGSKPNPVGQVNIVNGNEDRTFCYDITYVPGTLTVTPADASLNAVTITPKTVIYNGQSQKLDNATSLVTNGTTLYYKEHSQGEDAWSTIMPEFKNVGMYTIDVKAVNHNYNDATASATLTIQQRPVVITGNSDEFTYNGEEQSVTGYTWTTQNENKGLLNGDTIVAVNAIAKATNVGTNIPGTITPSENIKITSGVNQEDVTSNYYITTVPGTITILPKSISITSKTAEKKYNGQALVDNTVVEEPELVNDSQVISYNFTGSQTSIGTSQNTFTASIKDGENDVTNNYDIDYNYGNLTVYGEISYNANGGTGTAPEADRYDAGDTYTVKENMFERAGYTFGSWNTRLDGTGTQYAENAQITALQNNVTLYAQWIANSDTSYVVETYLEGEDGNYPEDPNTSITRTATTDTTVSVTDADKQAPEGYALDPNADNVFEGTVAGDGSLVLKLYFAKDVIGPDPENPGDEIPDKYQILFTYEAKENGVVTGETYELHTFTDEDGNYVKPEATTPDAEVKATANAGYHIDKWIDESSTELGNGTAPEFGDTTYTTNQAFTVSFVENENVTINYEATKGGSVSLDTETVAPATGNPQGSTASADHGYHFVGWYLGENKVSDTLEFIPSKNNDGIYEAATYTAKFEPDTDTKYVVERYFSDDEGNYKNTPDEVKNYTATTDTKVSVTDADKQAPEGYALDPNADNVFEGTVAGDGSLILKVYFAKDEIGENPEDPGDNIPDKYQILFTYKAKENGVVTGETYELHTFTDEDGNYVKPTATTPNADVKATANAGYHIDKWIDESSTELGNGTAPEFGDTTYTTNQAFTVSFVENENVTINYEATKGGSVSLDSETVAPATGNPQGSTAKAEVGYTFDGWYLGDTKVGSDLAYKPSRNADGIYEAATYTAKFIPNDDTPYTVNIYLSDANGNYGDPATSDVRTATTDTKVSVTDADKQAPEGYALDPNADNVFEGTVAGDGSLILKVYFAKDEIGENPEDPGDNIPDKYQILFTYEATENGQVEGTTYELHTFTDEDGNYVEPTPIVPEADVVATPDAGYHIDKWVDESSTDLGNGTAPEFDDTTYTTNQTFTVSFAELESVTIHYEAKDGGSVTNAEDVINPEIGIPEGSKAVCNDGYEFDGWYLNNEKISSDLEFVPTKNAEGRYEEATYVAVFKKKEIPVDPDKKDDDTNTSTQTNMNAYMTMLIGSGLLGSLLLILRKKREQE